MEFVGQGQLISLRVGTLLLRVLLWVYVNTFLMHYYYFINHYYNDLLNMIFLSIFIQCSHCNWRKECYITFLHSYFPLSLDSIILFSIRTFLSFYFFCPSFCCCYLVNNRTVILLLKNLTFNKH